jgi:hypothetical protein
MARQGARSNEDYVDADVVVRAGIARHQIFRCGCDPGEASLVDREIERGSGGAGLDLDERDKVPASHNEIDFPGRRADPRIEDFPALEP